MSLCICLHLSQEIDFLVFPNYITVRSWKHYAPQNPYVWNKCMCGEDSGARSVVLTLERSLESYEDLLKHRSSSPSSVFYSEVLSGRGLRICIPVKFPDDTDADGPLTEFGDLLLQHLVVLWTPRLSHWMYFFSRAGHCLAALGLCLKLCKISMHFSVQWLLLVFSEENCCTHH